MSATLYALVVLQGSTLSFSPGYPTLQECTAVYQGPYVRCFPHDPQGTTWSAFFKIEDGAVRAMTRIPNEAECQRVLSSMKAGTPTACRQLDQPYPCAVQCRIEIAPTPPAPPPPTPKPDSFGEVSVGPSKLAEKDTPVIEPYLPEPKPRVRTAQRRVRYAQQQFDPIGAIVSLVTAPFAPRDW
jgi:hypothetical protein